MYGVEEGVYVQKNAEIMALHTFDVLFHTVNNCTNRVLEVPTCTHSSHISGFIFLLKVHNF